MVVFACSLAAVAACAQRQYSKHVGNDRSTYVPETPIWVQSMGNTDCVPTLDLRDGRRVTGYLRGHSIDDDGTPTVFLTPPLAVQMPAPSRWRRGRQSPSPEPDRFPTHAITVPVPRSSPRGVNSRTATSSRSLPASSVPSSREPIRPDPEPAADRSAARTTRAHRG